MDLHNIIFFGFTLHNELVRCSKEYLDQYARFCYFYLCALGKNIFVAGLVLNKALRADNLTEND
jgi:hypothetical protein